MMALTALQGPTFKVLGIGVLALLLLVPLAQVRSVVAERAASREQAVATIASRWGGMQRVGAPVFALPYVRTIGFMRNGKPESRRENGTLLVLADRLAIGGKLTLSERRYGIFATPVYLADLKIAGEFAPSDFAALEHGGDIDWLWRRAELRLPIADVAGVRSIERMKVAGQARTARPTPDTVAGIASIAIPLDLFAEPTRGLTFDIALQLAGTQQLHIVPLARHTRASLAAPWPHPSFDGGRLPTSHVVTPRGFRANWQALDLNRTYPQSWSEGSDVSAAVFASTFGVALLQPVDDYARNVRTGKYGLLFISLTFVALFLFEVLRRLRVHPVQYLLVGLALSCFYLVLLALSEQMGFDSAYLIAAASVALIVGGYAAAVLATRRDGLLLGGGVAGLYALLYGLVVSERYALLIGSLGLLATVAALMYLTRRIDWYRQAATDPASLAAAPCDPACA